MTASSTEGRERPVIFSGPMVRAILAGRKTQTRRALKLQPIPFAVDDKGTLCDVGLLHVEGDRLPRITLGRVVTMQEVPFAVGDRLWVRERAHIDGREVNYAADYPGSDLSGLGYRPSIHMPRWASRITLEVTEVRIERLHNISHEDAAAEGLIADRTPAGGILRNVARDECRPIVRTQWQGAPDLPLRGMERAAYRDLWNSIHGKDAWDANPWVAAITFRPVSVPPSGGKALEPASLHPGDLGLGGGR